MNTIRLTCVIAALGASTIALAGPLDPPAGPISSTNKPLAEVEPRIAINPANTPGDADSVFKITRPGSYYLTGPILGSGTGKHGIEIDAWDVSIDLMGFSVDGNNADNAKKGIVFTGKGTTGIAVVNGIVRNWPQGGIDLSGASTVTILNVRSVSNNNGGIKVGVGATISDCAVFGGSDAIVCAGHSTISNCTVHECGGVGFLLGESCVVTGCAASDVVLDGFNGFASLLSNCVASDCGRHGFDLGSTSTIDSCGARDNGGDGIRVGSYSIVTRNRSFLAGLSGAGAGIRAVGNWNRVEDNHCFTGARGIQADGFGNYIVRNTCGENTQNWVISVNNVIGPVLDRRAPASPALVGNSGPSSLGTTDANANFTN